MWGGKPCRRTMDTGFGTCAVTLRVQVPNNHIFTQNLYYNYYYPNPKYQIIGYMDPLGNMSYDFVAACNIVLLRRTLRVQATGHSHMLPQNPLSETASIKIPTTQLLGTWTFRVGFGTMCGLRGITAETLWRISKLNDPKTLNAPEP